MLKTLIAALVAMLLLIVTASAQDYRFDGSVSGTYAFTKRVSDTDTSLTATHKIGSLASVRMHLSRKNSLEIEWGHTSNDQNFIVAPLSYQVQVTINDFTGAYVFNPVKIGKIEPFVLGGAGAISITPGFTFVNGNITGIGAVRQTRAVFVYGVGVDYPVWWRLAVRAQYRGLIFKAPDFNVTPLFTGSTGHMAEPSIGLVFRF